VVEQPILAFEGGGRVRVERLVAMEQDMALLVQEAERRERDARERTA
jgi:hypothetical protein